MKRLRDCHFKFPEHVKKRTNAYNLVQPRADNTNRIFKVVERSDNSRSVSEKVDSSKSQEKALKCHCCGIRLL